MAGILKRGPRNAPKFYVQFYRGQTADGKWVRSTKLLKSVENMFQARQELARVEREVQAGRDPFPETVVVPPAAGAAGSLLEQWSETLKNRNARDDRSRITRYLVRTFGKTKIEQITLPAVMNWIDDLAGRSFPRSRSATCSGCRLASSRGASNAAWRARIPSGWCQSESYQLPD